MKNDRTFFVGGNWKCNGTAASLAKLCAEWNTSTSNGQKYADKPVQVVISPPSLYALSTKQHLPAHWQVALQNCWTGGPGAYTGEICAEMLVDSGIEWVILGHSERRSLPVVKESDATVAVKTKYAISKGLGVILCIGELLEEREAGKTMEVNERQLAAVAAHLTEADWAHIVIAYEPVWAIGTGKVATPELAQEVHKALRQWLSKNISPGVAKATRIIYGGSVKPDNAEKLAKEEDIDGFLVGGASLKPDFVTIVDTYECK